MGVVNQEHRTYFTNVSRSLVIGTGDAPGTVGADFIPGKLGQSIYVQRIAVHVTTAAAQAISFVDGAGVVIAVLPASAAVGVEHVLLDHPTGVKLTQGEELDITGSAGVGCRVDVTAYQKLTGVLSADDFKSS